MSTNSATSQTTRNRDRILEAIDQLRHRKARPDIQRICSYLFRRYHVGSTEAKADLDWCVARKHVLRVEYKGNISYRNAAKKYAQMRSLKNSPVQKAKLQASKDFMELLTNVFGELFLKDPDYLESGVPPRDIIDNILTKDNVRYTRNYVAILLVKEVSSGNLVKLDNGNFLLGPCAPDTKEESENGNRAKGREQGVIQEMATSSAVRENERTIVQAVIGSTQRGGEKGKAGSVKIKTKRGHLKKMEMKTLQEKSESVENLSDKGGDNGNLRLGGRRKKAKKVFDPSDNNIPKKRGRPQGSLNKATLEKHNSSKSNDDSRPDSRTSDGSKDQGGVCSVCHIQNKRGPNDRMVACRECSNKAHFSCLNNEDDMMLKMYPDNTWQCPHCKTCVVCYETSDAGDLVVCLVCADGYHASCHQPRITEKTNIQKWLCINCQVPEDMKFNDIQSNIGDSLKIVTNDDDIKSEKDSHLPSASQSRSNSRNSNISDFNSPTPSPTPPHLSPQTTRNPTPDRSTRSNTPSQSQDSEEPDDPNIDPTIPDATHWTPEEVYQYFYKYFPEEAAVFKEQEIDGRSLLLLKRMDVLTNLNLKLGPALKIYRHVTMLQVRRDDPRLYWL